MYADKKSIGTKALTEMLRAKGLDHHFKQITLPLKGVKGAICICNEVIKFTKENGRYPKSRSKDKNEQKLGGWLGTMRKAKKGNGDNTFYPILEQMAIEAGYPDMFNLIDLEAIAIEKCQQVINFLKEYGRYPTKDSKDQYEKILGNWVSTMRKAKKGKCKNKFYPILDVMVIEAGYPDLFSDLEDKAYTTCKEVIIFKKQHGRYPSKDSKDKNEKKLGHWLISMRKAKQGKGTSIFYSLLDQMVIEAGYPDMFDIRDLEDNACTICSEVIEFRKSHGRYPKSRSEDKNEQKLGSWLVAKRYSKKGKRKNKFYPILDQMAIDAGYPDMFNLIDLEDNACNTCMKVIDFIQEHERYPNAMSKNANEKKLGQWLTGLRRAKHGNGCFKFYPILDQMAIEAGYPDMFDIRDLEGISLENCQNIIKFIQEHERYPKAMSKNANEKKLGQWLTGLRQSKKGNGSNTFYPSLDKVAKKAKLPNMFNSNWKDDLIKFK